MLVKDKKFLISAAILLVAVFGISLIQNKIRYGHHATYSIWNTIGYLICSLLMFLPVLAFSLRVYYRILASKPASYWWWAAGTAVLLLPLYYLFSGATLHAFGFYDDYVDFQYARQYFGREALYHLIALGASSFYVYQTGKKSNGRILEVSNGRKTAHIRASDVEWIEAEDHYLNFHTKDATYIKRATLSEMARELEPDFIRTHRKYLVNKRVIKARERNRRNEYLILQSGKKLKVSRSYAPLDWQDPD